MTTETIEERKPDIVRAFSKEVKEDPAILHRRLRKECPVAYQEGAGGSGGLQSGWLVTRYEDITAVTADAETFGQSIRWAKQRRPPLESNPPEHPAFRRLMQPFFMPGAIAKFEPTSRGIAERLIEPLIAAGGGDFAREVARPLPPQVLLTLIGQPAEDWAPVKAACEESFLQNAPSPEDKARFDASTQYLWDYSRAVVEDRKANPRDPKVDIVSALLAGQIDGEPVDEDLIVGMVRLVLAAGHDSTTSAVGICIRAVARNPEIQQQLREKPEGIPAAIEEFLRLETPVIQMPRTAMRDTELGGRQIRKGDKLLLVYASGNHDEEAFENPDDCDVTRWPNRHLSFGIGPHVCIGNSLARQEIRVTLETLLARTRSFEIDEEKREFWHPYGAVRLELTLTPA